MTGENFSIGAFYNITNKSSAVAEMGDRGHNRQCMGRKEGSAVPLSPIAGNPSNAKWPGPRSTSIPSGVLIHPAVWPQYTWAKNWGGALPLFGEGICVSI